MLSEQLQTLLQRGWRLMMDYLEQLSKKGKGATK